MDEDRATCARFQDLAVPDRDGRVHSKSPSITRNFSTRPSSTTADFITQDEESSASSTQATSSATAGFGRCAKRHLVVNPLIDPSSRGGSLLAMYIDPKIGGGKRDPKMTRMMRRRVASGPLRLSLLSKRGPVCPGPAFYQCCSSNADFVANGRFPTANLNLLLIAS